MIETQLKGKKNPYILDTIKKNKFVNIPDDVFEKYTNYSREHPDIIVLQQIIEKFFIFDFVIPILEKYPHENILEIGCHLGLHSSLLSRYGKVSATDLKELEICLGENSEERRENIFKTLGENEITFKFHNGKELPFPDESFDVVFNNSVIEHVSSIERFNSESFRVLKPGGICICITSTPALSWYRFLRFYMLRLPFLIPYNILKVMANLYIKSRYHKTMTSKVNALLEIYNDNSTNKAKLTDKQIRSLYPRLKHVLDFPIYNKTVIEQMADSYGISINDLIVNIASHFENSPWNEFLFYSTPETHGEHYENFISEARRWNLDNWIRLFKEPGFQIEDISGFRFQYFNETGYPVLDSWLNYNTAKYAHIIKQHVKPSAATEFVLVAKKPL